MSDNKIHTLGRIDQAIRGINNDGTDDGYIPPQSENGALERIEKSIKDIDIKGIKSGLPKVTNADNGKVLQVKNGKWGKGDEKLVHISSDSFLDNFHELSEKDTLYLVSGEIEEDARLNESIESEAASVGIVTYYPTIIPPEENHEPWRAFHDDDEYGGWSTRYENEESSAFIQYDFQNDFGMALSGIVFNTTYTYLGEEPAPEELPKIHLNLELQVCDDSIHHNWTTIWNYDGEVNDIGLYGTWVFAIDHIYAVRLVCKNSIYDDGNAMISIGNFKFFGMAPNEESESREIWYKGHKFGNVGEGGGSGGGSAINECIYYGNGQSNPSQITLSKPYTNYDFLIIRTLRSADSKVYKSDNVFEVLGLATNDYIQSIGWPADDNYWTYQVADNTTLAKTAEGMNNNYHIYEIYGIKLGSGGQSSSGGPTRTVLYEPPAGEVGALFDANGDMLTLSDDVRNYDEIIIIPATTEGDNNYYCTSEQTFRTADLLTPGVERSDLGMGIRFRAFRTTGNEEAVARLVLNDLTISGTTPYQTLYCTGASGIYGPLIHRVIGVKY